MAKPLKISKFSSALLQDPHLNKGLAFTQEERRLFELDGLLPPVILSLEEQLRLLERTFSTLPQEGLCRYRWLRELRQQNETLFYALFQKNPAVFLPIIYTPGIAEACLNYPQSGLRPEGFYLSASLGRPVKEQLANAPEDIALLVVTDGSRILGLGDLGANGMGIVIGKSALYTGFAHIDPKRILPVMLDAGTDNEHYLADPAYMGWRHKRLQGKAYEDFIAECCTAFQEKYPHSLLHWEDFSRDHASLLLERYRHVCLSFNDDIQGTASVTLAAILAALLRTGRSLKEEKILIFGAGSAGCGIASLIAALLEQHGVSAKEARKNLYLVDRDGLITENMETLTDSQKEFARPEGENRKLGKGLRDLVHVLKPSTLIGVSGQKNAFTEDVLKEMGFNSPSPLIFPLSNPTDHAETTPWEIYRLTNGRAMICTGSPFAPLDIRHTDMDNNRPATRQVVFSQVNNAAVFPGIGLGALACGAREISTGMFLAAAVKLAKCCRQDISKEKGILPQVEDFPAIATEIAKAVAQQAMKEKICPDFTPETFAKKLSEMQWKAEYKPYLRG